MSWFFVSTYFTLVPIPVDHCIIMDMNFRDWRGRWLSGFHLMQREGGFG